MNSDQEAFFDEIYGAHHRALHSFLHGKTGDPQVALDLLQETFLRVWQNLHIIQKLEVEKQGFWIFAVARNLTTDYFRKRSRQSMLTEELTIGSSANEAISVDDVHASVANKEEVQLVQQGIEQLPEDLRTVFTMSVLGGLSGAEIADRLGKPAGTVRYQLSMARQQLVQHLQSIEGNLTGSSHVSK